MKSRISIFVLFASAIPVSAQSVKSDILAGKARADIVLASESILARRNALPDELPTTLKNPFNPAIDDSLEKSKTVSLRTEKELIAVLAAQLMPSGSAERDGARFLLLGQRKVKVGDHVPILFENVQYDVEISAIEGATFTIRCRNEEFTRPIKPGKNQ
jgi:hypothetical protein